MEEASSGLQSWCCRNVAKQRVSIICGLSGGAIPLRMKRLSGGVGLRHPVMSLQVALRAVLTRLAWGDLSQTGQAYSAAE